MGSTVQASPTRIEAFPSTTDSERTSRTSTRRATSSGGEQFSHVAGWQAFEATRNALLPGSSSGRVNPMAWVTFTDPEVAQVGLSETAAREQLGETMTVTKWDIARVDRAKCDDDEDGFIKLVSDRRGVLIGATIVASRAGEMSGELSLAIAQAPSGRRCGDRRARLSDVHHRTPADDQPDGDRTMDVKRGGPFHRTATGICTGSLIRWRPDHICTRLTPTTYSTN